VRSNHCHTPYGGTRNRQHVENERIIAPALRRYMRCETLVRIGESIALRVSVAVPFVEAEGRVRDHDIEAHQVIALDQGRRVQRIAPVDACAVLLVQQHVEARERSGLTVRFLAEELIVAVTDFFSSPKKQRAGAAGRIADAVAGLGMRELGDDLRDLTRREELARLLASIGSELEKYRRHRARLPTYPTDRGPVWRNLRAAS